MRMTPLLYGQARALARFGENEPDFSARDWFDMGVRPRQQPVTDVFKRLPESQPSQPPAASDPLGKYGVVYNHERHTWRNVPRYNQIIHFIRGNKKP